MLCRTQPERAQEFTQGRARQLRTLLPSIRQQQHQQQDGGRTDEGRHQEHHQNRRRQRLYQERSAYLPDGHADAEHAGDGAALRRRHLIGQDRDDRRKHGIEGQLRQAPAEQQHRNAGRERNDDETGRAAHHAADQPGASHAEPRRGPIAHASEHRIADERKDRADPQHHRQLSGRVLRRELPHAQRDRHEHGRQQRQPHARIGQRIDEDKEMTDARRFIVRARSNADSRRNGLDHRQSPHADDARIDLCGSGAESPVDPPAGVLQGMRRPRKRSCLRRRTWVYHARTSGRAAAAP